MPEIKVLISKETHAKLREAQRMAGISEQRLAVGALLEFTCEPYDPRTLAPDMVGGMHSVRKVLLLELAK